MKTSVPKKLDKIRVGINGVLANPEILEAVSAYGYPEPVMKAAQEELVAAEQHVIAQINEYGGQYGATQEQNKSFDEVYAAYMVAMKVARVALKGDVGMLSSIKANGQRNRTISGWLVDSRAFCTNLLASTSAMAAMTKFGYTKARITELLGQVDQVEKAHQTQLSSKGGAQQSTVDRDKALDKLFNWYSDFRAIARIALYEQPQLLEKLGIVVKN